MSKARLVITALFVEGQTASEVAARYGVHRAWVYKLKARYLAEGEAAFEPRSRRPKTSPHATPAATGELVLRLRKQLTEQGLDAGADTIGWHLQHHHQVRLSRATIHRILARAGAVVLDPGKRPRSSYLRFAADQPNECWGNTFTDPRLCAAIFDRFTFGGNLIETGTESYRLTHQPN
jgi:transposase